MNGNAITSRLSFITRNIAQLVSAPGLQARMSGVRIPQSPRMLICEVVYGCVNVTHQTVRVVAMRERRSSHLGVNGLHAPVVRPRKGFDSSRWLFSFLKGATNYP